MFIDRKKKTLFEALKQVFNVYKSKGHTIDNVEYNVGFQFEEQEEPIHTILADNEFQALKDDIQDLGMDVHVVSKNEHSTEIEKKNRVIKERARAIIQTIPYKNTPKKCGLL
jgi:hypothetical protein